MNYEGNLGNQKITIKAIPTENKMAIHMIQNKLLIAENIIARPIRLCSIHLLQADELVGPELIITWKLNEKTNGVTIFRIPENLK